MLESGQTGVDAAAQASAAQESAEGLAQQSTQDRDAAAATFQKWMRNLWKIAEVALSDQPQWLKRLGRMVRSWVGLGARVQLNMGGGDCGGFSAGCCRASCTRQG